MTPGNATRLTKAAQELQELARSKDNAQSLALRLLRTLEDIHITLTDLVFRPDINS